MQESGGKITKENVNNLVVRTLDSNIFDLTDNLRKEKHRKGYFNS
jgi:DNA polymerase III delta subunit